MRIQRDDGTVRSYVAEKLNGTLRQNLQNGLAWTSWRRFKRREGGGWHVTIPPNAFDSVDQSSIAAAIDRLNSIDGDPFIGEICTQFIEHVFGGVPMFQNVAMLTELTPLLRIPEPAAPIFASDAVVSQRARRLLDIDRRMSSSLRGEFGGLASLHGAAALAGGWLVSQISRLAP